MAGEGRVVDTARADKRLDLERRVLHRIFWPALVILVAVGVVNVMTLLTEAQRAGTPVDVGTPWILEFSSVSVLVVLVPLVATFMRWVPLPPRRWYLALPLYLGMSMVFSGVHVLGMVALRKLAFWALWGRSYIFFDAPLTDLVYEYRKDLLPFSVIVVVCHLARRLEENRQEVMTARTEAHPAGRLTLRSGSRTIWLDADAFGWASAAGNYVDLHAGGASHLARMTLSALRGPADRGQPGRSRPALGVHPRGPEEPEGTRQNACSKTSSQPMGSARPMASRYSGR